MRKSAPWYRGTALSRHGCVDRLISHRTIAREYREASQVSAEAIDKFAAARLVRDPTAIQRPSPGQDAMWGGVPPDAR